MKKFCSITVDTALLDATNYFKCNLNDLEYEILQHPSKGFLGINKKEAIIIVSYKAIIDDKIEANKTQNLNKKYEQLQDEFSTNIDLITQAVIEPKNLELNTKNNPEYKEENKLDLKDTIKNTKPEITTQIAPQENKIYKNILTDIDNSLYINEDISHKTKDSIENICDEIKHDLQDMLQSINLDIDIIEVSECDKSTLYIFIDGKDSALLIGEKGYRYKALGYLLFNWINPKYGYIIKLEIAEFLRNQEKMIKKYLEPIIQEIKQNGKAQTKPLDGVLLNIALKILRSQFPDKYISYRNAEGDLKYIIINHFLTQKDNSWIQ